VPITGGDKVFTALWPGNTTPQAPDGVGNSPLALGGYVIGSVANGTRYIRFYDAAVAPNVANTAAKFVVPVLANSLAQIQFVRPPSFVNGLWVSVTIDPSGLANQAPAANDVLLDVLFQ
jgi:hypothetical protein